MTDQHPITPPPELVQQWAHWPSDWNEVVSLIARWGADQELEACCEWLSEPDPGHVDLLRSCAALRAARRPKPPSLKEQALAAQQRMWDGGSTHEDWKLIRRALEALPDD